MIDALRAVLAKLLGPRDDDPLGSITADQLAIVLRSIEDKYVNLQDENQRLIEKVEAQQREITRLKQALNQVDRHQGEAGRV